MNNQKEINQLIDNKVLRWEPYIGKNYFNSQNKVLIVGESHYFRGDDDKLAHADRSFTKNTFNHIFRLRDKNVKFYKNLTSLLNFDEEKKSKVAFYNFIQREMDGNKDRPSKSDYEHGWKAFFELANALKPNKVIFLSVAVGNEYIPFAKEIATSLNWVQNKHTREHKVSRYKSREISLTKDHRTMEMFFIKHPSQFFSTDKWKEYLKKVDFYI